MAPLPASTASAALSRAFAVRVIGTPTIAGFSGGASPPALCATGPPDWACATPAGNATAMQATSASGSFFLRLTMFWVSFRGIRVKTGAAFTTGPSTS